MSENCRVFITGMSALTASGHTADETWAAIQAGQNGIDEIKQWDLSTWRYRLGGEIKAFQPATMLPDRKLMKVISRQDVMGIHAAVQAVEQSQLIAYRDSLACAEAFNEDTAVYVGSPGNKYFQQYDFLPLVAKTHGDMQPFAQQLFDEVHPMWLLRILPNNVLAYTGITYGFKGINQNITNHAVSGTQAIIEGYHAIQSGQAKRAVVVAYDMGTEPQALYYYGQLGVLSDRHLHPFAHDHDGTILGDGAAALILESEASVRERNAFCYAELVAGASTTEAQGLFSLEAEGTHLASLVSQTLKHSQVTPDEVGFIVAHGNGNPKSDISEAQALQQVFASTNVPVTGFKWSMGHTICASGVVDAVLASYALRHQSIPGIPGLEHLAPDCQMLHVSPEAQTLHSDKPYALVLNRGYASMNACLVIKSCDH